MRARVAFVVALASLLLACGEPTSEPTMGDGGGGGEGEGGAWVVPDAGLGDYACPPGELVLDGGGCHPAGTPPAGCPPWFEQVGDGCEPILPPGDCGFGEVAYPGETQCHPVAPCAGGKWGAIPVDASTVYVDASFVGTSDGGEQAPFITIGEALVAAPASGVVAVAAGTYGPVVIQDKPVALWGVCPQQTALTAAGPATPGLKIQGNASGTQVHMLSIHGTGAGIRASDVADVLLDHLHIHDTDGNALDLRWSSSPQMGITLRDLLIESAQYYAVVGIGLDMDVERMVVRDTRSSMAGSIGRAMDLEGKAMAAPPQVRLDRVLLQRSQDIALFVRDVDVTADALVVDDTAPQPYDGSAGQGLHVKSGFYPTHLVAHGLAVRGAFGCGVCLLGSEGDLEAVTVRDVDSSPKFQPDGSPELQPDGFGLAFFQPDVPVEPMAELRVLGAVVERTKGCGVVLDGNVARLESVIVRDVEPFDADIAGGLGRGITAQSSAALGLASELTLRGARIEHVHELGVLAQTQATLETVAVSDVKPDRLGRFGRGIEVEAAAGFSANAIIEGSAVDGAHDAGIIVLGGSLELDATAVRHVAARSSDGMGGVGIALQAFAGFEATGAIRSCLVDDATAVGVAAVGAEMTLDGTLIRGTKAQADGALGDGVAGIPRSPHTTHISLLSCHLLDNSRAGAAAFSSLLSLTDTALDCNAIALNGEGFAGAFEVEDRGGNVCGCLGVREPCQLLSAAIPPPMPLDQSAGTVDQPPAP